MIEEQFKDDLKAKEVIKEAKRLIMLYCPSLPTVDVEGIANEKLSEFKEASKANDALKKIELTQDLVKILETAESNIQKYSREFDDLKTQINKLSDNDLIELLSNTGLKKFEEIAQNLKKNLNYYSAALLWMEKRKECMRLAFFEWFSDYITFKVKPEIDYNIGLILYHRQKIGKSSVNDVEGIKEKLNAIEKAFKNNSQSKAIIELVNKKLSRTHDKYY